MPIHKHLFALVFPIALLLGGCGQQPEIGSIVSPIPTDGRLSAVSTPERTPKPTIVQAASESLCDQIAFALSDIDMNTSRIVVACSDGSEAKSISPGNLVASGPSWSPDGLQLAFVGQAVGGPAQIFVVDVDGGNLTQIESEESDIRVIWRPDGRTLSIQSTDGAGLYWWKDYNFATRKLIGKAEPTFDFFFSTEAWSPDGTKVAYMSLVEQAERNDGASQIHVRGQDGSDDRALTVDTWANVNPIWSPDGQSIAFLSEMGHYNSYSLYVMNSDGSERRELFTGPFEEYARLSWSPDGRKIAVDSALAEDVGVQIIDVKTGEAARLTEVDSGQMASNPEWRPARQTAP